MIASEYNAIGTRANEPLNVSNTDTTRKNMMN